MSDQGTTNIKHRNQILIYGNGKSYVLTPQNTQEITLLHLISTIGLNFHGRELTVYKIKEIGKKLKP